MTMQEACHILRECGLSVRLDANDGATVIFRIEESHGMMLAEECIVDRASGGDQWIGSFPGPGQRQYELHGSLKELVDVMCQLQERMVSNPQLTLRDVFPDVVKNADCYMT